MEYDGLDETDALARGFRLDEVRPPQGDDDEALARQMFQKLADPGPAPTDRDR